MGKNTVLAFLLSLLVIMGYNYYIAQKYPAPTPEVSKQQKIEALSPAPSPDQQKSTVFVQPVKAGKDFVVETDLVRLVITSSGARIKSCQLKKYAEEKIDLKTVQTRLAQIEREKPAAAAEKREFLQREEEKLNILRQRLAEDLRRAELVSLAAQIEHDFSPAILFPEDKDLNIGLNTARYRCAQEVLILSQDKPEGQLTFTYTDAQGRSIKKVYHLSNSNYAIGLEVSFSGWDKNEVSSKHLLLFSGPDVGLPQAQRGRRAYGYEGPVSCFKTGEQAWVQKEKYARNEQNTFTRREHTRDKGRILWTGLENKYFLSALIPAGAAQAVVIEKNKFGEQKVALKMPWEGAGPYNFELYLGPKKEERLIEVGVNLDKSIDYGFFGPIARFIYQILLFFSRWTHNFGWAIVLLCLVVKITFYPLTHRSFESMQKMQAEMKAVQPEMNALREKYKGNPQKLNKEIMELYRRKGINPLASCQSGCLPLLLQMPVFFALYGVLYNSIELRGAPFIGWLSDLSAKDPYYVLPILMGVSMFVQQKLTGMGAASGPQQEQAKMMAWMMPVFLTWIFASLPSGVVLYWLTFNLITAAQQLIIRKKQPQVQG